MDKIVLAGILGGVAYGVGYGVMWVIRRKKPGKGDMKVVLISGVVFVALYYGVFRESFQ